MTFYSAKSMAESMYNTNDRNKKIISKKREVKKQKIDHGGKGGAKKPTG